MGYKYKYYLVYSPTICEELNLDKTVVLLCYNSKSWSVRPYVNSSTKAYYVDNFTEELTSDGLRTMDNRACEVDPHKTTDKSYWNTVIRSENRRRGFSGGEASSAPSLSQDTSTKFDTALSTLESGANNSHSAIKGSQHQIQVLINEHPELLNKRISAGMPEIGSGESAITWVSPLQAQRYEEYKDADFLRALGMDHLLNKLGNFWPRSGPRWDALAKVSLADGATGLILVEAKSHPPEAYGGGCKAANGASRDLIEQSLEATKRWLNVDSSDDWMGELYQYANRLAHLYFFREIAGVQAWLVNIYFADDPFKPTSINEWQAKIPQYKAELGLSGDGVPYCIDLVIDAPSKG